MTNPNKTNSNEGGNPTANQGKQGDPSQWNTQKTGQTTPKDLNKDQKGGSQMGGKSPPSGGPDQFKPEKPMEGKPQQKGNQGGKGSATDPYPPTNPDRPVMGGSQGNVEGQKGGQGQSHQGGQFDAKAEGNVAGGAGAIGTGAIDSTPDAVGGNPAGLEEEE